MNNFGFLSKYPRVPRARGRALAAAGAGVLVAAGGLAVAPGATAAWAASGSPVCSGGTCAATYASPGTGQSFTVPAGVSSVAVTLYGGTGGENYGGDALGGDGAEVTANLATYPGEALGVDVGGAGVGGADNGADHPGGVNGGGAGVYSGGGGGATDVTTGGAYLLVAGGGGGGGADEGGFSDCISGGDFLAGGPGGNADMAGSPGQGLTSHGFTLNGGSGGQPGTTATAGAGGAGGTYSGTDPCSESFDNAGRSGAAGSGMTGGSGVESTGGGGGGGYFGGGVGGAGAGEFALEGDSNVTGGYAGGGGGASYGGGSGASGYTVNDSGNSGQVNGGNGEAVLSWADPIAAGNPNYSVTADQVLTVPASGGLLSAAGSTGPAGDTLSVTGPASGTSAQGGVVTVNADGSFSYAPPAGYTGSDSFGYTVSDASGDYATGTVSIAVQPIAQAITFTSTAPSPGLVGNGYQVTASGGASGNPVTYSIDPSSTAGACSVSSGTVSFTGPGTCQVDADQAGGGVYTAAPQASQTITVDQAPAFVADTPPLTAAVGQEYSYTFTASGSPTPAYTLAPGAPSWLAFNASTGTVDGVPPKGTTSFSYMVTAANPGGTATAGPYTVSVTSKAPKADIAAALSCPKKLTKGTTGTCSLSVINNGPQKAQNLTVAATLNADLSEVSCTGGCAPQGGGMFVWSAASLAAGTSVDYTITVKAAKTGSGLVVVEAAASTTDPHPLNNVASVQISIKA